MNVEHRINVGKIQQLKDQRTWTGTFQIPIFRLRVAVQENEFPDAGTVDGSDSAEIKNDSAATPKDFSNHLRKRCGFFAINDATLTVNDYDLTAISSFQTELQLQLLMWYCVSSQAMRLRPWLLISVCGLHVNR